MGRNYYKLISVFFISLISSCAFDPPEEKLEELGGNYFVSYDSYLPNDGLKIVYTKDKELFKVIASNCIAIYRDSSVIVFSKNQFEDDTKTEYFTINLDTKNELRKIDRTTYNRKVSGLQKISFPKSP